MIHTFRPPARPWLRMALAAAALLLAGRAMADVTLYESHDFRGRGLTVQGPTPDLGAIGFADHASSLVVSRRPWEVCEAPGFGGRCVVLQPGRYPRLREMGLNNRIMSLRPARRELPPPPVVAAPPPPPPPPPGPMAPPPPREPRVTFYEFDGFHGRSFTTSDRIGDLRRFGFNDAASSVVVHGARWLACENVRFRGRCVILRPGLYPSLGALGLNNRISSVRELRPGVAMAPGLYEPPPTPFGDWRARPQERLVEVPIQDVRAVYGTPQQRCWVERQQVVRRADPGAGAVIGGLIGGILGHELAGRGSKDVGTVGGAIAGAAIGATASQGYVAGTQDVQRCATVPTSGAPAYWDVTYVFNGMVHHVQMTNPPAGSTLRVNERGEPRD